jgi:hypothetical protein
MGHYLNSNYTGIGFYFIFVCEADNYGKTQKYFPGR